MIGILVGAAAVAGLIAFKRARHRRWAAWHGWYGPRWHWHDDYQDHGHHHGRHHVRFARWGQRRVLYAVLSELECSPAQEKAIRDEINGLIDKLREVRDEKDASRENLADAISGAAVDRKALDEMFARHDQRLVALRGELAAALGRVHAILDDKQRARLAELVRAGLRGWRGAGPYR